MGNRAVITNKTEFNRGIGMGIYLHWNGGRDSIEGFLKYCEMKGFRGFGEDDSYAFARLTQVIANFFGGGLSVGVDTFNYMNDNFEDNGVYIVGDGWKIVDRKYNRFPEQHEYDLMEFAQALDEAMPVNQQIGFDFAEYAKVSSDNIKIGDEVYLYRPFHGDYVCCHVIGKGDGTVNGSDRTGDYYTDMYSEMCDPKANPNNYISSTSVVYKKKN